ncbi:MAG TPA: serine/threonine-protein kinase, partial [Polyangiaceae bacterium]|nr:serine/threonine-protein kinase [Polyangiaceae bacterium]
MSIPEDRFMALLREPTVGDVVAGRFRIEYEAGIGGMGIVYRAIDQTTGGTVALKVLRKADAAGARRFASEIEALESVEAPTIVRYISHGVWSDGQPYLAMEWIEGESLADRLERGPLEISEVLTLGVRIVSALHAAHARGVIHRDIKPGNVLLPAGTIEDGKVADFGLSRFIRAPHVTTEGLGIGTPGYAAPEQVRGTGDLDERADLFSLGCLLFRCLTNEEAFAGEEALTVIAKLVLEEPPRARTLRSDVPSELDELIARLLAKNRDERPASAEIVMVALDRLQRGLPAAEERTGISNGTSGRSRWGAVAGLGALGVGVIWACFAARAPWHTVRTAAAATSASSVSV